MARAADTSGSGPSGLVSKVVEAEARLNDHVVLASFAGVGLPWMGGGWGGANDVHFATIPMVIINMQAIIFIIALRHRTLVRKQ